MVQATFTARVQPDAYTGVILAGRDWGCKEWGEASQGFRIKNFPENEIPAWHLAYLAAKERKERKEKVGQAEAFPSISVPLRPIEKRFSHRFSQIRSDKRKRNQNSPLW